MASSLLSIGISGLNAAQAGLVTTGHNLSNAATDGYSRQIVVQSTNTPVYAGYGFLGQGTQVETVKRVYSQFLSGQVLNAQAKQSEYDTYNNQLSDINNMLADADSGISPALQDFFKGVQEVSANPSSIPARQSMLSAAQAMAARFQTASDQMTDSRQGIESQIVDAAQAVTSYAQQLADMNQQVVVAQSAGNSQPANDLLDKRDQLVSALSQYIQVSTTTESSGSLSVFFGNGQPLVVGNQATKLTALPSSGNPQKLAVNLVLPSGNGTIELPSSVISGGKLGGLLSARDDIESAQNQLGLTALGLIDRFNEQHSLGSDLTGALGGDFFKPPQIGVQPSGSATVSVADAKGLSASDYLLTSNGGGNYSLVRQSDGKVLVDKGPLPQVVDGLSITPSSSLSSGQSVLIQPTLNAARDMTVLVSDPRSIAAGAGILVSPTSTNTGTGAVQQLRMLDSTQLPASGSTSTLTYSSATNTLSGFPNGTLTLVKTDGTATTYNITAPTDTVPFSANSELQFAGLSVEIGGTPANGDSFTVSRPSTGVSDNRNAVLLGNLQTDKTMLRDSSGNPTASFQSVYSQLVSDVGSRTRQVQVNLSAQNSLLDQAKQAQQSLSGVNLDEEAANLIRYQQAYQAAGKVMSIASTLFDQILSIAA
ncbi:MAG: flagellar hook-associated protein FlgK [Zoogloea sp.]|nr:flagellar hook-associated protein FlgK [Zoogloea sp.]